MKTQCIDFLKLAIVGAGGLGAPVAWGLVEFLTTKKHNLPYLIRIIDHDEVELSNLNRQIFFHESDIGQPKASTLKKRLSYCLEQDLSNVETVQESLALDNIEKLIGGFNMVLDCTDSTETKFLINDFCVLKKIPFVYAGVSGATGQSMAIRPGEGPCLRCLFGEFSEQDYQQQTATCRHSGVFGAFAGMVGFIQVREAIEMIEKVTQKNTVLHKISYPDCLEHSVTVFPAKDCPLGCGFEKKQLLDISDKQCPETFLFTKLQLEKTPRGSLLDVRLGSEQSAKNVTRSIKEEGFTSCGEAIKISENQWSLRIAV